MAGYGNFPYEERRRIQGVFSSAGVERRALWFPRAGLRLSHDPDQFHERYLTGVREMAPRVARQALLAAGLNADEIDFLVFVSSTGYACPGFAQELAHSLGVQENRPVANLLAMGCSALIPAIERAWDRLMARPGSRALVVAVEVSSATYWIDHEMETAIGNSLFGDGAAAVALTSNERDVGGPRGLHLGSSAFSHVARIDGFRTIRDGRHLQEMGYGHCKGRLRGHLSREVPEHLLPMALRMMDLLELPAGARVAIHPSDRKVLAGLESALMPRSESWGEPLEWAREVLRDFGNMLSPTPAFVLQRSLERKDMRRGGEPGALVSMGQGLAVEGVKLTWLD